MLNVYLKVSLFMPLHWTMPGAYSFIVFHTCVLGYECTFVCTNVCTYVRDPVRLRLRHLYQVEFCSFIVSYPTAGASVYCGHISCLFFFLFFFFLVLHITQVLKEMPTKIPNFYFVCNKEKYAPWAKS